MQNKEVGKNDEDIAPCRPRVAAMTTAATEAAVVVVVGSSTAARVFGASASTDVPRRTPQAHRVQRDERERVRERKCRECILCSVRARSERVALVGAFKLWHSRAPCVNERGMRCLSECSTCRDRVKALRLSDDEVYARRVTSASFKCPLRNEHECVCVCALVLMLGLTGLLT